MPVLQRSLLTTLIVGIAFTAIYIAWMQHNPENSSGRTNFEHFLGVLGLAAVCGTLVYPGRPQSGFRLRGVEEQAWHMSLGNLALLLILLHSGFRFGSVFPILAFTCLGILVVSGLVGVIAGQQTTASEPPGLRQTSGSRQSVFPRSWLIIHVLFTAGFIAFSLIHILVVFYY